MDFRSSPRLPSLAVTAGATSPNPGSAGSLAWSTTLGAAVVWNGTIWKPLNGGIVAAAVFQVAAGVVTILESYNVSSITRTSDGRYQATYTNPINANSVVSGVGQYAAFANDAGPTFFVNRNSTGGHAEWSTSKLDIGFIDFNGGFFDIAKGSFKVTDLDLV